MEKNTRRYSVRESRGGSFKRFFVWDAKEQRMIKGKLVKYDAVGLEHKLNERKFKE
jgi:hypothetical protein